MWHYTSTIQSNHPERLTQAWNRTSGLTVGLILLLSKLELGDKSQTRGKCARPKKVQLAFFLSNSTKFAPLSTWATLLRIFCLSSMTFDDILWHLPDDTGDVNSQLKISKCKLKKNCPSANKNEQKWKNNSLVTETKQKLECLSFL